MIKNPLVSVIMNCLNGERYLRQSIESLMKQTYPNWECIFWDNNSTDNSKKIFLSYNDNRLKYFHSKDRVTLYKARNLALEKTSGEFISFLDTDDYWTKEKITKQVNFFMNNSTTDIVYSNYYIKNEKWSKKSKIAYQDKEILDGYLFDKLMNKFFVGLNTISIRKKIMINFDERYEIIGDFDFITKISQKYNFGAIKEPLTYYRFHQKNFSLLHKKRHFEEMKVWKKEKIENNTQIPKILREKYETIVSELEFLSLIFDGKKLRAMKILYNMRSKKVKKLKYFLSIFLPKNFLIKFINQ